MVPTAQPTNTTCDFGAIDQDAPPLDVVISTGLGSFNDPSAMHFVAEAHTISPNRCSEFGTATGLNVSPPSVERHTAPRPLFCTAPVAPTATHKVDVGHATAAKYPFGVAPLGDRHVIPPSFETFGVSPI